MDTPGPCNQFDDAAYQTLTQCLPDLIELLQNTSTYYLIMLVCWILLIVIRLRRLVLMGRILSVFISISLLILICLLSMTVLINNEARISNLSSAGQACVMQLIELRTASTTTVPLPHP
jgi:hypothetical protein